MQGSPNVPSREMTEEEYAELKQKMQDVVMASRYQSIQFKLDEETILRLERMIAEERVDNERLRQMLRNRNVSEDTIDAWVYDDHRYDRVQALVNRWQGDE